MKLTDGLFHKVFDEIALEYPEIKNEHYIVDIGAARLADTPEIFDVMVMPNLYGDILSDIAAQITGSVGLGGSANIGEHVAMFEAIHGSAPMIAGQNIANPSGLLLGAVMMLVHIGQAEVASRIHNAFLRTLEDGVHTADIYREGASEQRVGTKEFGAAVVERLGQLPQQLKTVQYQESDEPIHVKWTPRPPAEKKLVGVDVFLDWIEGSPDELAAKLQQATPGEFQLNMITNRGVKVWPKGVPETFCTDHWRCRFTPGDGGPVTHRQILNLLGQIESSGLDFIKTEHLCTFDGEPGFSLGQGQ
jgi:isocitrate dehydrogenase